MAKRIQSSDLERLLANDATPDEEIAAYLKPAALRALPLAPILMVDESKVELPPNRGILGLSVKSLNDRANRKRLAAYETRIMGGWKGLRLLAEGDSWFLYPILLKDVIDNLSNDYAIYSVAAAGDTLENMMRGTTQLEALIAEHKFNGLLLSAGGNDIAGDMLRTYLTVQPPPAKQAASYLGNNLDAFLANTQQKLDGLFGGLTTRFPDLKIFCHGYDWPFPRTGGLWLAPALIAQQVPGAVQAGVLKVMIDRYYQMLGNLADKYRDKVHIVDCRGSIGESMHWFDELHPLNPGYTRVADRFRNLINKCYGISAARGAGDRGAKITWYPNKQAKAGVRGSGEFQPGSAVTIGRSADSNIVLTDDRVSRNHARLEIKDGEVVFTDLNTTNGSLLDGRRRVGATAWRAGQKLQIGDHLFELAFAHFEPVTLVSPLVETSESGVATSDHPTNSTTAPDAANGRGAGIEIAPSVARGPGLRKIEIALALGSIAHHSAPAYAVGVFENINPTAARGAALAIDAEMDGMLSTVVQGGMFESRLGEISLVPMPRQRSLTGLIAFAGLGAINTFGPPVLEIVGEKLAKALSMAKILEFATVPIGAGTGGTIKEFVTRFLTGFLRGLTDSKDGIGFRRMSICEIDKEKSEAIRREIYALAKAGFFQQLGYEVVVSEAQTGTERLRSGEVATPAPQASPVYLQVERTAETTFEYCILSAELGAAIQLYQQTINLSEQTRVADMAARLREFDAATGTTLAGVFVPADMQELICRSLQKPTAHLVIIHDQDSSTIPWEALYFKDRCPALDVGVSRLYRLANRERVSGRPILSRDATLRMLVVENPTGDLVGAQNEGDQLTKLFKANRGDVLTLRGANASRANVLTELSSGAYDILHYAGHADFVEIRPEASGLILRDGRLTAADMLEVGKAPQMIFLNACESGRIRGSGGQEEDASGAKTPRFVGQVSLAESFLMSGIANFIGTYWPVNDDAAFQFANAFYGGLLSGKSLSLSMREARQAAKSVSPRDWANYMHFGDPLYVMRQTFSAGNDGDMKSPNVQTSSAALANP